MPKRYSIAEARSSLPTIVDQVEAGTEIELTRRGKPVALLISHRQLAQLRSGRPRFTDVYHAFLQEHSLQAIDLDSSFFHKVRAKRADRKVDL